MKKYELFQFLKKIINIVPQISIQIKKRSKLYPRYQIRGLPVYKTSNPTINLKSYQINMQLHEGKNPAQKSHGIITDRDLILMVPVFDRLE